MGFYNYAHQTVTLHLSSSEQQTGEKIFSKAFDKCDGECGELVRNVKKSQTTKEN